MSNGCTFNGRCQVKNHIHIGGPGGGHTPGQIGRIVRGEYCVCSWSLGTEYINGEAHCTQCHRSINLAPTPAPKQRVRCTSCNARFTLGAAHQQTRRREDGMDACAACVGCHNADTCTAPNCPGW